ncbi:unnamed protein product, partial [Porites lobata]
PRIWRPAVRCRECHYPNDYCFMFCQRCGFRREVVIQPKKPFAIDISKINKRVEELNAVREQKPYEQQKTALEVELSGFLASLPFAKTLKSATAHDIIKFLVWKDKSGRTKVHCHMQPHGPRAGFNLDICPVYNFERYMSICKLLKADLRSGFLFRSTKGSSVTAEPFLGSAVYNRPKFYLGALGLDSGETPHSLRAGCSITLSLLGVPEGAILKHIGWRSASMLHHYTDLREFTRPDSPRAVLAASSAKSVSAGVLAAYNSYDDLSLFTSPLV